jgi:hypothetical protein
MAMLPHDVYAVLYILLDLHIVILYTKHLSEYNSLQSIVTNFLSTLQSDTRTVPIPIMCQLQITSYGCGHQRKTLFELCALT